MDAVIVFAALLLLFTLVARRLEKWSISAPITFTLAGFLLAEFGDTLLGLSVDVIHTLAEVTLVLLLFHDAAQVHLGELRRDTTVVLRLLLVGLPLTMVAGYFAGLWLLPGLGVGLTLWLAASLAPTDAGLGAPTVLNPVVPERIRRVLNVESGLNDGLATPVVLLGLALAAETGTSETTAGGVVLEILLGVAIGVAAGYVGGLAVRWSGDRGWTDGRLQGIGMLALPILAYTVAALVGGNGFIAAFVSGLAFAVPASSVAREEQAESVVESVSDLLGYAVWFVFGSLVGPILAAVPHWRSVLYAVLALTVLRMAPVALSLIGTGLRTQTVLFIGWFGPRGLASLIFALLSLEELGGHGEEVVFIPGQQDVLATIGLTVLFSVFAHGLSGGPLAERYGAWFSRTRPPVESGEAGEPDAAGESEPVRT